MSKQMEVLQSYILSRAIDQTTCEWQSQVAAAIERDIEADGGWCVVVEWQRRYGELVFGWPDVVRWDAFITWLIDDTEAE